MVEFINTGTTGTLSEVARGKEDTRDHMVVAAYKGVPDETRRWQTVKSDSNRTI